MKGPVFFGVRHLSPAAAFQLRKALDQAEPELVLVEGPSDLNSQMEWLCHPGTRFPAAILAYTRQPPVRTVLWPFAVYSPEIQAILWANEHGVECRFMDLPSSVFLALRPWPAPVREEDGEVRRIVKAADKLSAYIKCLEEVEAGNNEFGDAAGETLEALRGMEMEEVSWFLERFAEAFGLTLDGLQRG